MSGWQVALLLMACACSRETPPPVATAEDPLAALDTRAPVPLLASMAMHQKESMQEHLVAVQEIVEASATNDFARIQTASAKLGSSPSMGQMCTHIGAAAPGFSEQALAFHRTADRLVEASRQRDGARVLAELSTTLQACTSCHAAWRQHVVDEATWRRLTAAAAPAH